MNIRNNLHLHTTQPTTFNTLGSSDMALEPRFPVLEVHQTRTHARKHVRCGVRHYYLAKHNLLSGRT